MSRIALLLSSLLVAGLAWADAVPEQSPPAAVQALPEARAILADFLAASGGEKAFAGVRNLVIEGRQSAPAQGIDGKVSMYLARPDNVLVRGTIEGMGVIEQGYDGTTGWDVNPILGARVLEGAELEEIQRTFNELLGMSNLDAIYPQAKTVARSTFDGHDAWELELHTANGRAVTAWFDPVTKLQLGMKLSLPSPLGDLPATITFEDYKDFGGFKFPVHSKQTAMGISMTTTFDSVRSNVADFPKIAPPPEVQALLAKPAVAVEPAAAD